MAALKASDQYETPQPLFDALDRRYCFKRDLFATEANAKVPTFFTLKDDAFRKSWHDAHTLVRRVDQFGDALPTGEWDFANPPYSKPNLARATEKAKFEAQCGWAGVFLIPATPGTGWFHDHIFRGCDVMASGSTNRAEPELEGYWFKLQGNGYQVTVTFLRSRIGFWLNGKPAREATAKTDSCIIEWRPKRLC